MTIAVMQPYFFPYIGYFQLVKAVEQFVFFDDVNFIKKGWIHRNQILHKDGVQPFTIPLRHASQNRKINETEIADYPQWRDSFIAKIRFNYSKAPNYEQGLNLAEQVLFARDYRSIAELAEESVIRASALLQLETRFTRSSSISYEGNGGQEKILSICGHVGATYYINPKNGAAQYERAVFKAHGIELLFLEAKLNPYVQFDSRKFDPGLSILDVIMFNSPEKISSGLLEYNLLEEVKFT